MEQFVVDDYEVYMKYLLAFYLCLEIVRRAAPALPPQDLAFQMMRALL